MVSISDIARYFRNNTKRVTLYFILSEIPNVGVFFVYGLVLD